MKAENQEKNHPLLWGLGGVAAFAALLKAGWIFYSRRYIDHHAKLKGVLCADQDTFVSDTAGKVNYFFVKNGQQRPILLIHNVHMTAGLHELAPIFEAFRTHRPVYAMDLPGFGASDRTDRPYRPSLFQSTIVEFIREKIGVSCDVITMGLSSEFVAMAARENPEWIHSIIMINPTGFNMPASSSNVQGQPSFAVKNLLYTILAVPLWSLPIFDLFSSRPAIVRYYQKRFEYALPPELADIAYNAAHQPGAHFAPMVYLSGKLSTPSVREKVYRPLNVPVLVLLDNESTLKFDMLPSLVRENPNWSTVKVRQSRGMPHFDRPGETFRVMDEFWKKHEEPAGKRTKK